MHEVIGREEISAIIHKWMGKGVSLRKVYQAVGTIIEQIATDLVNDEVVTVRRFGTLSPHMRHAHLANNVNSGTVQQVAAKRSVKFHPHEAFKWLIRERQKNFRQPDEKMLDDKHRIG
jgi:nucleoid DNA-binding protein